MAIFTAGEDGLRDLFDGQVGIGIAGKRAIGGAEDEQSALRPDFFAQSLELFMGQRLGGDIEKVGFAGLAVLPVVRFTGCIAINSFRRGSVKRQQLPAGGSIFLPLGVVIV